MSNLSRKYGLFDFTDYIGKRIENFTGRTWVFQEIDNWLGLQNNARYFLLTGEPGSGKSAIAARLAYLSTGETIQPSGCRHLSPGFLQVVHFCSATDSISLDPLIFARSVALQLSGIKEFKKALLHVGERDINIAVQIQAGTVEAGGSVAGVIIQNLEIKGLNGQEAFNRVVLDPLQAIYDKGYSQPIVILIDSLDEALAALIDVKITDLLVGVQGHELDSRVRFILTSRSEPRVENRFLSASGLSLSDPMHKDNSDHDIAAFVAKRLDEDTALAEKIASLPLVQRDTLPTDINTKADGNFQYVAFLLNAAAKGQQSLSNPEGLPPGLDSLYHDSLYRVIRLGRKDPDSVYKPFLGILSVAFEPMTLELLQTYIASENSLWDVYKDLFQFVETVPVSTLTGEQADNEDRYQLYHQSVIDFLHKRKLVMVTDNGQMKVQPNEYYLEPGDWHARIVNSYARPRGDWSQVDWSIVEQYALQHLVAHLYQLCKVKDYRKMFHTLLETQSFIDRYLVILGQPHLLLDDLRLALNLALDNDDLAQAWRHIREYRRITRQQLDFDQLLQTVEIVNKNGDYGSAIERTTLYGYMPNSQALARLWIAWNAAVSGHTTVAESIVKDALEKLPPRGTAHLGIRQAGSLPIQAVEDAISETMQRLLIRISQAAQNVVVSRRDWLQHAMSPWPASNVDVTVGRLSEPLTSWGKFFHAEQMNDTIESLFQELQTRGSRLDNPSVIDYDPMYFFKEKLAAGLFNSLHDPAWLEHVKRTVAIIAQDDYPSYREMALFYIAAATLAQEDSALVSKALAAVLEGMFKPSPGFWGDTVAAAMDGMERENNQGSDSQYLLNILKYVEETGERGVDPSVYRKTDGIMLWRRSVGLPEDPWSFIMRRRSAVAAVLHRQGDNLGAEALLHEAINETYEGSYAGFRALARLSLACRLLEWHRIPEAIDQTVLAQKDASHVLDPVLKKERIDLVNKMRQWITDYGQDSISLSEDEALAQLQRKNGLERGLFIEFLSALWSDSAASLKRLLPLSLDDATTVDAVLGRLLAVEALQAKPGRPFLELVKALQIDIGIENV